MKPPKPQLDGEFPAEVKVAYSEGYRRGWADRGRLGAAKAGSTVTEAKQAAARANGAKPTAPGKKRGRPRKNPPA